MISSSILRVVHACVHVRICVHACVCACTKCAHACICMHACVFVARMFATNEHFLGYNWEFLLCHVLLLLS